MEQSKNDESLLLLLELADKYLDVNKKSSGGMKKKTEVEEIHASEAEQPEANGGVTKKEFFDSVKAHKSAIETIVEGEDAEFMFSVLVGEHFVNEDDLKSDMEEYRKREEDKKIKEELSKEEQQKMKQAKEVINSNINSVSATPEQQGADVQTLLDIMDVYMDIYKP